MQLLHTSITVKDMNESISFYTQRMGMKLVERRDSRLKYAEIAILEIGGTSHRIELTWWKDKKDYTKGEALDHIAFGVADLEMFVEEAKRQGIEVVKEPFTLGTSRIAFIEDPSGIVIELIEHKG